MNKFCEPLLKDTTIIWGFSIIWSIVTLALLWIIGFTEFSYLGTNLIKKLYNLFAPIYRLKWLSPFYTSVQLQEKLFLSALRSSLEGKNKAKVLDLACGNGRLSLMLLGQSWFEGHIQALDFSEGMLNELKTSLSKLNKNKQEKINMLQTNLTDWKGEKENFDVIILTEASEFLPNFLELISQISFSLKPNGLFLLTKPPEWLAWMYFGRKQSAKQLTAALKECGFTDVQIFRWSPRYDVVHARK